MSKKPGRPKNEALTAKRHEEILEAAAQIFAERGYACTDLQVIADRLAIGKGTLYRYFPSKQELFLAAVDRGMRQINELILSIKARYPDPLEGMQHAIEAYLGFFDAHPEYVELIIQERAAFKDRKKPTYFEYRDALAGERTEMFRQLISTGKARDIPPERALDVINSVLYGTIFTNYFTKETKPLEVQAQDIVDIILRGILSDTERRQRENL